MLVFGVLAGCSGLNATAPSPDLPDGLLESSGCVSNRWVWGNWTIYVPADQSYAEAIPVRTTEMHYNVKTLLENSPCSSCLWVSKFLNNGDGTISIDISIRHPYPGNNYFTGFDVRGIFYSSAHYFIENPENPTEDLRYFPSLQAGDPQVLNPDGYTQAFHPFKYDPSKPPIIRYQSGGKLGGTFDKDDQEEQYGEAYWPYICYYSSDIRRHFAVSATITRIYHIALPPGPWEFGYSVDACWAPPTNVPVYDIEKDFPWQANTLNPYDIQAFISGPLVGYNPAIVTARFYMHVPELYKYYHSAIMYAQCYTYDPYPILTFNPIIVSDEYVEFTWELVNQAQRPPGSYPVLLVAYMGTDGDDYLYYEKGITELWWENATIAAVLWVTVES